MTKNDMEQRVADRINLNYLSKRDCFFPVPERKDPTRILFRVAQEEWDTGSEYEINGQKVITLLQINRGAADYVLNGSEGIAGAGQLLCYGLSSTFSIAVREPLELRILCLLPEGLPLAKSCGATPGRVLMLGAVADECWAVMGQILACALGGNPLKQRIVESLTRVWLDWCASTQVAPQDSQMGQDPAERAYAYIQAHMAQLRSIGEVAQACGCSPEHLSRVFLARYQERPWQYVRRRQAELAAQILRNTGESIEAVAQRFGYADRYSFSRAFRQYIGVAPGRFRQEG